MHAYLIKFADKDELSNAVTSIGASEASLEFFRARFGDLSVFVRDIPAPAANILKQEALSRGADAAVHAQTITCGVKSCDAIIFGSAKQLNFLADKLEKMPWWGLGKLASDLRRLTADKVPFSRTLPNGSEIQFGKRALLMGVINLTDNSFYDNSRCGNDADVLARALQMVLDGADILDLGAESTRPGADRVDGQIEISRITSALCAIRQELPHIPISIDTTRSSVARAALDIGADIINDISGLTFDINIAKIAAEYNAMLVVMHTRGTPATMQQQCEYGNLISEVCTSLEDSCKRALESGLQRESIIIDPGLGFAKNYNQNLMLIKHIESFKALGYPLLIGASRKSFVGKASNAANPEERLCGTLAISSLAAANGADIIRVHDVMENRQAIMTAEAIRGAEYE